MTDSNEQVERVAEALWDHRRDPCGDLAWGHPELHANFENSYREMARAAIAAMTPTQVDGDDLEALVALALEEVDHGDRNDTVEDMCRRILAAGFRLTPTPRADAELTGDKFRAGVLAERMEHSAKGYDGAHDAEHGLVHLLDWAMEYAARGEHVKASSLVLAAKDMLQATDAERKLAEVREAIDARDDEVRSCHSPGSREAESIIASGSALVPTSVIRNILDSEARS